MNSLSLESILSFDSTNNSHLSFIQKIAEPFITYKSQQSSQNQINIAGYKTLGAHLSPQKIKHTKEEYLITKDSIQKYLFTFCFEIGCDLPSEDQIKLIYNLLLAHSKPQNSSQDFILQQFEYENQKQQSSKRKSLSPKNNQNQTLKKTSLDLLIRLCIQIYIKSKKSNTGGIIERLIIGIRKQIEIQYQKISKQEQTFVSNAKSL